MSVFRKLVDDEGNETYEEVEVAELEIPEEVIREHPAYKQTLSESIERRKKLKEANDLLKSLQEQEETDEEENPEPEQAPERGQPIDVAEIARKAAEAAIQAIDQREADRLAQRSALDVIIDENHLSDDPEARSVLGELPIEQAKKVAKVMAQRALRFDDTPSGNDLRRGFNIDNVKKQMGFQDEEE